MRREPDRARGAGREHVPLFGMGAVAVHEVDAVVDAHPEQHRQHDHVGEVEAPAGEHHAPRRSRGPRAAAGRRPAACPTGCARAGTGRAAWPRSRRAIACFMAPEVTRPHSTRPTAGPVASGATAVTPSMNSSRFALSERSFFGKTWIRARPSRREHRVAELGRERLERHDVGLQRDPQILELLGKARHQVPVELREQRRRVGRRPDGRQQAAERLVQARLARRQGRSARAPPSPARARGQPLERGDLLRGVAVRRGRRPLRDEERHRLEHRALLVLLLGHEVGERDGALDERERGQLRGRRLRARRGRARSRRPSRARSRSARACRGTSAPIRCWDRAG